MKCVEGGNSSQVGLCAGKLGQQTGLDGMVGPTAASIFGDSVQTDREERGKVSVGEGGESPEWRELTGKKGNERKYSVSNGCL